MQVKEVEEILLQKVDKKTVEAIMQHIQKKTNWREELEGKVFKDSNYVISVGSNTSDPIAVQVYETKNYIVE